jgi:molybdate transport system regulatory protein
MKLEQIEKRSNNIIVIEPKDISRTLYEIKGKIWIEIKGQKYIDWRSVELLEQVDKFGSIAAAARYMGMGYRNAWLKIEAMNQLSPKPLVIKFHGGVRGGKAILTAEGGKVVREYQELLIRFHDFLEKC